MLTRGIELDPFDFSIAEKFFRAAKRTCLVFAVIAIAVSMLDLFDIRSVEAAAEFINRNREQIADLPTAIRSEIGRMSAIPTSLTDAIENSVTVRIPKAGWASVPMFTEKAAAEPSPVDELASLRHQDAIEMAMVSPAETAASVAAPVKSDTPSLIDLSAPPRAALAKPQTPPVAPTVLASATPSDIQAPALAPAALPLPQQAAIPIPINLVPMPKPAPGAPPPSPAQRLHLEGADRAKAERCLANAIYFEARDQPYKGQVAVAQVVINRVFSGIYPRDVCGVIYQNASRHLGCQFTFACDGKRKVINEYGSWARARRIARETLDGQLYVEAVGTSTHYHATYVHPNWVHEMRRLAREGIHLFYRPIAWGNGSDEPIWSREQVANRKKTD